MHATTTSLYRWHKAAGARFTDFAGWKMPVNYPAGTITEHHATRNSVGLFDISHMAQLRVSGPAAASWLAGVLTADISKLREGSSTYALLCREDGGVIDDLFVYRTGAAAFLVVANAARRVHDVEWLTSRLPADGVTLEDESDTTAMLAVQGPRAAELVERALGSAAADLPRFGIAEVHVDAPDIGETVVLEAARTGYTGEDGFELFLDAESSPALWEYLLDTATAHGIHAQPVGLAARDSLRLEAGFALYGHELTEEITPVEARLLWACDLDHDFIGREAILARKAEKPMRTLRRLVMTEPGVPREGYPVLDESGSDVGVLVSGGRAPSCDAFIANAYVDRSVAADAHLFVAVRSRKIRCRQNRGPVYKPSYDPIESIGRLFDRTEEYTSRHIGPREEEIRTMLEAIGVKSMDRLIDS
ncbi:MAG: glycine cleavage system aminomethyltransferase GcvT, partial [Spirochaetales bacterium]|nr:glycine cleavage system aminomethyltransferase GcvT [Spirochaetales bacterium]